MASGNRTNKCRKKLRTIVVSNSSPLIGLSAIDKLGLLEKLYQTIYVADDVFEEVVDEGENRAGANEVKNAAWIEKRAVDKRKVEEASLTAGLGKGESASLVLAESLEADLLIIDDLKARKFAQNEDRKIIGILGILLFSKTENLIAEVKNPVDDLMAFGYWISPNLYRKILETAGE